MVKWKDIPKTHSSDPALWGGDDDCEDQGMGLPKDMKCRCGASLMLKPLGWTCVKCATGYGR